MRQPDASLLEHRTVAQDASAATTALGPLPSVFVKARCTIELFDFGANRILQAQQPLFHLQQIGRVGGHAAESSDEPLR